ncbi:MAG TPA: hypothetical protein VF250_12985 [Conexibacter sp.]
MALPCAFALLLAILLLAPPLGRALFEPTPEAFWAFWQTREGIVPEPAEHAAYLFALLAPALLAILVLVVARRPPRISPAARRFVPSAAQALGVAFLVACLIAQRRVLYGNYQPELAPTRPRFHYVYFTPATFVAAGVLALLIAAALSRAGLMARAARWTRETRARRTAATAAAALLTALWLLTAIHSDATVGNANPRIVVNLPFWLDEPFAVLDGHHPLVDFHAQYGQLMAYLAAGTMAVFGASLTVYSLTMVAASCLAMVAVFATIRRVVRRSLVALALYVPVLSTSFFTEVGPPENRYGPGTLFSLFPMRYAGAYAVAWLTARHLDDAWPRRPAVLFFAAGVALVNNIDFGLPAFAAALVACAAAGADSRARLGRLLLEAAAGLAAAFAAVALLIVATAGALPHFELLLTFPRIYGVNGFGLLPMPSLGLHVAIYATYAAALVLVAVRLASGRRDVLTAMLAWCAVFGLGSGAYYAGRSLPDMLINVFSPWALTLALLLVAASRAIAARPSRRPTPAEGAVIVGFALAICSIAQTPAPWTQLQRLGRSTDRPLLVATATERAIRAWTKPGERVAILTPMAHRIAYRLRVDNVAPYANLESMPLRSQLAETVARMREAGVRRLFLPIQQTDPEQLAALEQLGFAPAREAPAANVVELAR